MIVVIYFLFKQKTAYEMRISDWSSDVCSSDLKTSIGAPISLRGNAATCRKRECLPSAAITNRARIFSPFFNLIPLMRPASPYKRSLARSEEHTSELQSLMRISYAVLCLQNKIKNYHHHNTQVISSSNIRT